MDSTTFELIDGKVIMKSQTERVLTRNDILDQISYSERRCQELIEQSTRIKGQYDLEVSKIEELKSLLSQIPTTTPTQI